MRTLAGLGISTAALVFAVSGSALAEPPKPMTTITVNLSVARPAMSPAPSDANPGAQSEALRKTLYQAAAHECATLLETIAVSCKLMSANVTANEQAYPNQPPMLNANMNASYAVELK